LKYKKYFRKTSLKQEGIGELFLNEIISKKPKNFLEIGVFHGVTARNVCELLCEIHGKDFKYIGLDLFGENNENANEVIPNTKFNNPLKKIYFEYILRQDPYSIEAVSDLLKKFKKNVHLIKGNSNRLLQKIDMSKIDYVFLDGGHVYETVKNDLTYSHPVLENGGTILCDDYNLSYAPGVKEAIDEFVKTKDLKIEILFNRFAKIEKNKKVNKPNEELDNFCEECKKEDESVSQNLILSGYKICNSCKISKTIFPI
jgi:predicted O-methyltransferase YrrM